MHESRINLSERGIIEQARGLGILCGYTPSRRVILLVSGLRIAASGHTFIILPCIIVALSLPDLADSTERRDGAVRKSAGNSTVEERTLGRNLT